MNVECHITCKLSSSEDTKASASHGPVSQVYKKKGYDVDARLGTR